MSLAVAGLIRSIDALSDKAVEDWETAERLEAALSAVLDLSLNTRGYLLTRADRQAELYHKAAATYREAMDGALELADAQQKPLIEAVDTVATRWRTEIGDETMLLAHDPATFDQALDLAKSDRHTELMKGIRATATAATGFLTQRASQARSDQDGTVSRSYVVLAGDALAASVISGLIGWLLARAIAVPLGSMTSAMGRLATGDISVEVPGIGRRDEIGHLAEAMQRFKDGAIDKARIEAEALRTKTSSEAERAARETERAAQAAEQARVVEALAMGLDRLSAGDFVVRLQDPFDAAYERLRSDFNGAAGRLQETLRRVAENAGAIGGGSGEIAAASEDLSRRTEQQAASLEQTAAALEEITETIKRTAAGADHARAVVASAKADADASGEVVRNAVSAMSRIEGSARQIGRIIGVIDEIAFQTNLLALNAGVEAARAGEAGRGFAVVASEVRGLAQRSAEAAKEIKALISASSVEVAQGVDLVGATGSALERIMAEVVEINGIVAEIAASTREVSTALGEVNGAVADMDRVTQQNAAMVEETTAANRQLAGEAAELTRMMSSFRLGIGDAVERQAGRRVAPAAEAPARRAAA